MIKEALLILNDPGDGTLSFKLYPKNCVTYALTLHQFDAYNQNIYFKITFLLGFKMYHCQEYLFS